MRSFAHSAGKWILIISIFGSVAHATDPEYIPAYSDPVPWGKVALWGGGTLLTTIGLAQLANSEVLFASIYAAGAVYYATTQVTQPDPELEDYTVPISLVTLALANLTVLSDDDTSRTTKAGVNFVGLALVGTYWYQFERKSTLQVGLAPNGLYLGLLF